MGKIHSGVLRIGDKIRSLNTDGKVAVEGKVTKILVRQGLEQVGMSWLQLYVRRIIEL